MLGMLLGGLLGGAVASRPLLGAALGRRNQSSGGGGGSGESYAQRNTASQGQEQQTPAREIPKAQQQYEQPIQQPTQAAPMVNQVSESFRQAAPRQVTAGLIDDAPAISQNKQPGDSGPMAPRVVNQSAKSPMPVARGADEVFGSVPGVPQTEGPPTGVDTRAMPPRRDTPQLDGWPTQPLVFQNKEYSTDLGFQMQPSGSPSSYAPQFSYTRR